MPYVTLEQLEDRYGTSMLVALTDRGAVASGTVDPDTVARVLTDTDAVIDGHISARYVVPVVGTDTLLTDIAGAIAIYKLHRHEPDEKVTRDYKDALASLVSIARGQVRLSIEGVVPAETGGTGAQFVDRERPFTAKNLKGLI
ncbi:MAG: DUF1320 domain-containing protein [Jannaschia sp.]